MFRVTFFCRRSYNPVVRGSACPARYCTSSSGTPWLSRSVIAVTRKLCGDSRDGSLASFKPPLDHPAHVFRRQRLVGQPLRLAQCRAEQRPILIFGCNTSRIKIRRDMPFQIVPHRDLPALGRRKVQPPNLENTESTSKRGKPPIVSSVFVGAEPCIRAPIAWPSP